MNARLRVLCVDDEPEVLEGLKLHLRRRFEVLTANGGAAGLELASKSPDLCAVMSDMRMPGMDGAAFLAKVRQLLPHTPRILLTGQADLSSAISAVNDGQIFRFLQKPTPPPALLAALEAAAEQHRLVTAERVLLEQTLHGCIKALAEVLALTKPLSFARATRTRRIVEQLADRVALPDRWQVEVAALVSYLGAVVLSDELAEKLFRGQALTEAEERVVGSMPAVAEQLLASIPRLDGVRKILSLSARPVPAAVRAEALGPAAALLRLATTYERVSSAHPPTLAAAMALAADDVDADLATALLKLAHEDGGAVQELGLASLRVGMVFAEEVRLASGGLLVPRGFAVSPSFLERVRNFQPGVLKGPFRILAGAPR